MQMLNLRWHKKYIQGKILQSCYEVNSACKRYECIVLQGIPLDSELA